jgi:glycosyltransferase involved in cell wall biosynthesis
MSLDKRKVSIIIPVFNRPDLLKETLASIAGQSYRNWECIVVDDRSTENTAQVVRNFQNEDNRFRFVVRDPSQKKGANTCRAMGFSQATGEYVKFVDSDDTLDPQIITMQVEAIERGYDGVFCNCAVLDHAMAMIIKKSWRPIFYSDKDLVVPYLKGQVGWPNGCGLFRKEKITRLAPFSEDIQNSQEWIFHLKVITEDLRIGFDPYSGVKIRASLDSVGRKKSATYFLNRCKARIVALRILLRTGNPGKAHLLKVILSHMRDFLFRLQIGQCLAVIGFLLGNLPALVSAFFQQRGRTIFKPELITHSG